MTDPAPDSALHALAARTDLAAYQTNGLMLFALELNLALEDVHTVASTSLTDGPGDRKCDLVYVDRDAGRVVIAQSYVAGDPTRAAAPANKASDLNTAVAWLLGGEPGGFPEALAAAASELRTALEDDAIASVELWYCHNLPESPAAQEELDQARNTASALIRTHFPECSVESVSAVEVGVETLDAWYRSSRVPILITDEFSVPVPGGFTEEGDSWSAYCTSVPAGWLREIFLRHKTQLFSANVRDYLGSRRSDKNINHNIKETARGEPQRFWAYNNGLTALVHDFSVAGERGEEILTVKGLSIVNGAQTTGAIGSVAGRDAGNLDRARILARFVKCSDQATVREIIRANNSQNRVEPSDFRSNDSVQDRLRDEFESVPESEYRGARRGGGRDLIARPVGLVPSSTAAQALAAFHGEPNIAYNEKSRIWTADETYARFFSEKTTARHIVFVYSLLRAVEAAKSRIGSVPEENRTASQQRQVAFFRQRGSTLLLCAVVGRCMETIFDRAVPDPFRFRFRENLSPAAAGEEWRPIVDSVLAFTGHLQPALDTNLKSRDQVAESVGTVQSLVEATAGGNQTLWATFASKVEVT